MIEAWHNHQVPIILAAFSVLVLLRIYLHLTEDREQLLVLPKLYGADDAKAGEIPNGKAAKARTQEAGSLNLPGPRRIKGELQKRNKDVVGTGASEPGDIQTLIFFSSLTTATEKTAREYARQLHQSLEALPDVPGRLFLEPRVLDLTEVDFDEYFITPPNQESKESGKIDFFYLFLIPSYNIDTINDNLLEHLKETHHDFRIHTAPLAGILGYSVFGLGDRQEWPTEEEGFCFQAKVLDKWMA